MTLSFFIGLLDKQWPLQKLIQIMWYSEHHKGPCGSCFDKNILQTVLGEKNLFSFLKYCKWVLILFVLILMFVYRFKIQINDYGSASEKYMIESLIFKCLGYSFIRILVFGATPTGATDAGRITNNGSWWIIKKSSNGWWHKYSEKWIHTKICMYYTCIVGNLWSMHRVHH